MAWWPYLAGNQQDKSLLSLGHLFYRMEEITRPEIEQFLAKEWLQNSLKYHLFALFGLSLLNFM